MNWPKWNKCMADHANAVARAAYHVGINAAHRDHCVREARMETDATTRAQWVRFARNHSSAVVYWLQRVREELQ